MQLNGTNLNASLMNLLVAVVCYIGYIANGYVSMSKSKHISPFVIDSILIFV